MKARRPGRPSSWAAGACLRGSKAQRAAKAIFVLVCRPWMTAFSSSFSRDDGGISRLVSDVSIPDKKRWFP